MVIIGSKIVGHESSIIVGHEWSLQDLSSWIMNGQYRFLVREA
jgi:hypothetical protein